MLGALLPSKVQSKIIIKGPFKIIFLFFPLPGSKYLKGEGVPFFYRHRKLCSLSKAEKNWKSLLSCILAPYPLDCPPILRIVKTINHWG